MAGDVNDFADKEQSANFLGFHRLARQFIGVHASRGDFCFFVAFGACRRENPFMRVLLELRKGVVGPVWRAVYFEPALGEAFRKDSLESGSGSVYVAHLCCTNRRRDLAARRQIDLNGLSLIPKRGDLQDRRPAQPAMSDEHFLAEGMMVRG